MTKSTLALCCDILRQDKARATIAETPTHHVPANDATVEAVGGAAAAAAGEAAGEEVAEHGGRAGQVGCGALVSPPSPTRGSAVAVTTSKIKQLKLI